MEAYSAVFFTVLLYAVLETAWLWFAKSFYSGQFNSFSKDGQLRIRSNVAVVIVYPLLLLGFWLLVLNEKRKNGGPVLNTTGFAFLKGAVFGATVYGVYNLTNKATLPGYTWLMTAVDTSWGATVFGVASAFHSLITANCS